MPKPHVVTPPPPPVQPPWPSLAQAHSFDGDPVVLVRMLSGAELYPCQVKELKQRQIIVDGRPCEHVGAAPDGTWIYQMRAW